MTLRIALGVAVLGAAGSLCRWGLSIAIQKHAGGPFPLATLVINVLGSVVIGAVMGVFIARGAEGSGVRIALTAGFLGGFTTFSSFAFETWMLIERRLFAQAALYVAASVAVCVVGAGVGLMAGRAAGA